MAERRPHWFPGADRSGTLVAVLAGYGLVILVLPLVVLVQSYSGWPVAGLSLTYGELLDLLLTPWVGVGSYFLFFRLIPAAASPRGRPGWRYGFWLALLALVYLQGHSIHLVANALARQMPALTPPPLARTITFFDEQLGHWLWYGASMGLATATLLLQWRYRSGDRLRPAHLFWLSLGGISYGLSFGLALLEGQSAGWAAPIFLGLLLAMIGLTVWRRAAWRRMPAWVFFATGFTTILLLLAGWRLAFGAFIEPLSLFPGQ